MALDLLPHNHPGVDPSSLYLQIMALREAEFSGQFDRENPKVGEEVQIKRSNLEITGAVIGNLDARFLTLMTPLFGGARAKVDRGSVTAVA